MLMNSIFSAIAFSVVCPAQTNALKNQDQLAVSDDNIFLIMQKYGQFKCTFFKSFMKNSEAISLPHKYFNLRAFIIEKNKYISGQRLRIHLFSDNGRQAIETLIDINRCPVKKVSAIRIKRYHLAACNNSFKNVAVTG
jgi:hypothetical protein